MEIPKPAFQLSLDSQLQQPQALANAQILPKDGDAVFLPQFFSPTASDIYLNTLLNEIAWRQEPIVMFGRSVMQPRLTAWYGDQGTAYRYSGITMIAHQWTETLSEIKSRVESEAGVKFNSVLLNYYRNEKDSMGWHRDNERELGDRPVIASVSFGATRKFNFRYYREKTLKRSIELTHGSLLLMRGETQHYWEHSISKTARPLGPRINLTFRTV